MSYFHELNNNISEMKSSNALSVANALSLNYESGNITYLEFLKLAESWSDKIRGKYIHIAEVHASLLNPEFRVRRVKIAEAGIGGVDFKYPIFIGNECVDGFYLSELDEPLRCRDSIYYIASLDSKIVSSWQHEAYKELLECAAEVSKRITERYGMSKSEGIKNKLHSGTYQCKYAEKYHRPLNLVDKIGMNGAYVYELV